jgi:plasmid maintenance system antidote protein VapI
MTLDEYLFEHRLTVVEFARALGYHPTYVTAVKNGHRPVSPRFRYLVDRETTGMVKL